MILVAGLTPAWQQIMRFEALATGAVNRATDVQWCASGKVLNVGLALAHLGAAAMTVAPLGPNARDEIEREFAGLEAARHWIGVQQPTRVCTTLIESGPGRVTELVENASPLDERELAQFSAAVSQYAATAQMAILTGSLAPGAGPTFFRDLDLPNHCRLILDIRGPELIESLALRPLLIKPNRDELSTTLGVDLAQDAELHRAMREMNHRGAEWVVVTSGSKSVWASSHGNLYRWDVPQVDAINPIGSGDCLAAGIAWGVTTGRAPLDAIRLGIAAGIENVGQLLPARLDPQRVLSRAQSLVATVQ